MPLPGRTKNQALLQEPGFTARLSGADQKVEVITKRIVVGIAYRLRYARPMRAKKRTSIVFWKIAAGAAAIVLAKDLPELKHLPPDMCIEVEAAQSIAVREAECPTFFVMDPKTGKVMSLVLDGATGYEYAQSLSDGVKRGLVTLIRRPNDR